MATAFQIASLTRRERNINLNVGSFSETKPHTDKARWICLYPCYLNSKKKEHEGRKIPLSKAVENPTIAEIKDVLTNAGFSIELEANKVFPRELNKYENLNRGRVRVQLRNDDGTPLKSDFPTRKSVFLYVAETIPKLKTRGSGASKQTAQNPTASTTSEKKKKNKK